MSTNFPSFEPPTTNKLWFNTEPKSYTEKDVCKLEEKHKNWMESVTWKDKDAPYIGKKPDTTVSNEQEVDDQSDESEDEEDMNGFQDSPDDQNPGLQGDVDMDGVDNDNEDNSWMI